ncbi:inner membrane protein [Fodinibius salinus]|uniref:Inner membrane protein n=1 Tax=Fodinibius salinus TaxID=860790 RepID=A0A5D3YQX9_9BACT|nr:metal-dependent hydrolase [Fodinibius salinus]TYP95403.1 inner membrane protein [Fodinibius salinus]
MDPVTHGLIGATATQSTLSTNTDIHRSAAIVGLLAAMTADLDVLISNANDPLLNLEIHRQFSHSLIFIPVGALIVASLLWFFMRNRLSFKQLYTFSFIGYGTAGLADMFTSYGTKLLWPFLDERFSWNIISVFDPLFSLGIILAAGFAFYYRNPKTAWLSCGWILLYLLFGFIQHERAETVAQKLAYNQNHQVNRMVIKPTIANTLLWSIRYETGDTLYAHGVQLTPFADPVIYEGESAGILDWQKQYAPYKGSVVYEDIKRFDQLSEGYLIRHPKHEDVIGDGRYAMIPTKMSPLWGIQVDTSHADQHVSFQTFRNSTADLRTKFLNMVFGQFLEIEAK